MVRPRCCYRIGFSPHCKSLKPQGKNKTAESILLSVEETEALRLKNIESLDQTKAANCMGVSQSTFQRLLSSAYKKISQAIVFGKEIKIGDTTMSQKMHK